MACAPSRRREHPQQLNDARGITSTGIIIIRAAIDGSHARCTRPATATVDANQLLGVSPPGPRASPSSFNLDSHCSAVAVSTTRPIRLLNRICHPMLGALVTLSFCAIQPRSSGAAAQPATAHTAAHECREYQSSSSNKRLWSYGGGREGRAIGQEHQLIQSGLALRRPTGVPTPSGTTGA
ncbi:hypothetical protein K505DRAFT_413415 [Melanomma pulvis-pyrius CBS 109.77]|uniref:Uncharacterized protein n=1 Tax=Melanomma pulvis-pyrius CBS 109.77 TaxID=1314802 RepID=A0A6A6XTG8_9PLEO|nr:hypothetical protein K505DRAFT_413415 [Melanomma pulvis-pyrius CBS 109.77]